MEQGQDQKKLIFWCMMIAAALSAASAAVTFLDTKRIPAGGAATALALFGLAVLFKFHQRI